MVWRFLENYMNFMIIRRFIMYFADFRDKFCVFWRLFCFTGSNGYWRNPFYLSTFIITIGYSFVGKNHFFVEKYDKNGKNWNYFSYFFSFFLFFAKFLCVLWLAYCFLSIWIPYWLKGFFLWIYMFFEISKNSVTFSSFSVKVVFKSFFFII